MLKPAEMGKVTIIAPIDHREEIISSLHESGNVQLETVEDEIVSEIDLERESAPPALGEITSLTMEINRALEVFGKPPSPPVSTMEKFRSMWGTFFSPEEVEKEKIEVESREEILEIGRKTVEDVVSDIKEIDESLENLMMEISDIEDNIRSMKLLEDFDFENIEFLESSEYVYSSAGIVPIGESQELENELEEITDGKFVLLSEKLDEEREIVCIWTLSEYREDSVEALNTHDFEAIRRPDREGKPSDLRKEMEKELEEKNRKKKEYFEEIRELSKENKKYLIALREALNIEKERAGAINKFCKTETATIIQGWAPKDKAEKIREGVSEATDGKGYTRISEPENPKDNPPTLLQNPSIFKHFEVLTRLFGSPGRWEIDPTPLLAITYVIFFGLMLTDVAYGVLTLVISIGLLRGAGRKGGSIRDFSVILILGSVATIITGVITGSYFGNLFTAPPEGYINIASYIPGMDNIFLYNPVSNPMPLLLISIFIGVLHEYLGVMIGFWEKLSQQKWREAIGDGLSWLLLIPGASILVCHGFGWLSFSFPVVVLGAIVSAVALGMLLIGEGPMGIMDMFSMLGNIMSYTRILALALVTSSLALTFNAIVGMIWSIPIIGIIFGIILFVGAHLFSMIINLISSFVHSLRLHYVEFFGKFYLGDGDEFEPFKVQRMHTRAG